MALPENIYVREKDKQEAKIRNLEQRCKALDNEVLVLRQRMAVIEDRFRPEPILVETITISNEPLGTPISSSDFIHEGEYIQVPEVPIKKTRKSRKAAI